MDYLPLFCDLRARPTLVVGGGEVALRKARLLARCGAIVHVVAPAVDDELRALVRDSGGACSQRPFAPSDLQGMRLVVAATDDAAVNRAVAQQCRAGGIDVNVVDQPQLCSVIFPAIVDRDPITIAVSSGGRAPVLTRNLRALIESTVPVTYGRLAHFAERFRQRVSASVEDAAARRRFWESTLLGPAAEMVLAGREDAAAALMERALAAPMEIAGGEVYLVGAGPGDPDLLTFKALRLMQRADVVLYDRLVAPGIVALCRADAERVYVGKQRNRHAVPQPEINALLLEYAERGLRVLRLKGGDPFIFGRGGEEIELLAERGIPFQVVPGITAASGCACYAGIPLTHRDYAQSVRFVTGHLKDGSTDLNWRELTDPRQTLVFYMGLVGLPQICAALVAHGRDPATPVALIQQGTTPAQRVLVGTLATMAGIVAKERISPPTLTIVGDVVRLHDKLRWFGNGQQEAPA